MVGGYERDKEQQNERKRNIKSKNIQKRKSERVKEEGDVSLKFSISPLEDQGSQQMPYINF